MRCITPNKPIIVQTRLQKVDLSKVYSQKLREKFKKRSCSKTIGGPFFCTHPVDLMAIHGHIGTLSLISPKNEWANAHLAPPSFTTPDLLSQRVQG